VRTLNIQGFKVKIYIFLLVIFFKRERERERKREEGNTIKLRGHPKILYTTFVRKLIKNKVKTIEIYNGQSAAKS